MAEQDYAKLKVPELKSLLRARGLPFGGVKAVLVQRLQGVTPAQPTPSPALPINNAVEAVSGPSKPKKARVTAPKAKEAFPFLPSLASSITAPPKTTTFAQPLPPLVKHGLVPAKGPPRTQSSSLKNKTSIVNPVVATVTRAPFKSPLLRPAAALSDKSHPALLLSSNNVPSVLNLPSPLFTTAPRSSATDIITLLQASWLEGLWQSLRKGKSTSSTLAFDAISPHLFSSPQHDHQFAMSLRFVLSRLFLTLMSNVDDPFLRVLSLSPVIDCIPVVEGIWEVTTSSKSGETHRVLVLEATGEVIGSAEEAEELVLGQANPRKQFRLREDWSAYIERAKEGKAKRLLKLVRSSDEDDYPSGISKSCRQRFEDPLNATIAISFLFSQTTPHSISGEYQSSSSEAKALAGLPDTTSERSTSSKHQLGFYIPPAHHLESIHLPPMLSPDLAIVQTTSRAQFCLRGTGQIVGSEEEGVMPMWRELLACGEQGEVA